jgi:predicted Fe-Mo cluster-binding NifX family protein
MAAKKSAPANDLPKLAAPAQRALARAGVSDLSMLAQMSEANVMALHGMGPNAMATLKTAMKARKLTFVKR